jgi:hypothetical protein
MTLTHDTNTPPGSNAMFLDSQPHESSNSTPNWFSLRHTLGEIEADLLFRACRELIDLDIQASSVTLPSEIKEWRRRWARQAEKTKSSKYQAAKVAFSLVADLVNQGWLIRCENKTISLAQPPVAQSREEEQGRVRRALAIARDEQLESQSVRDFIADMEKPRPRGKGLKPHSIFSLMRDGEELANSLRRATESESKNLTDDMLRECIRPYIQFVTPKECCQHTGLKLTDIWRYFRYTWLTPSRSTPGRSMMILVRDAAAPNHAVIGIAALSSSIVQQSERDTWIGWDRASVLKELRESPTCEDGFWLLRSLQSAMDDLYVEDFKRENLINSAEMEEPNEAIVERLKAVALKERGLHQQRALTTEYRPQQGREDWKLLVGSALYRSKRADALSKLLRVRAAFIRAGFTQESMESGGTKVFIHALESATFREAIGRLVRHIKSRRVGINMMDISVAGAIAPYNALLGGKLVSLLLTSPEVQNAYYQRYRETSSVIASAMKGEPVRREPHLVLLCTTGLFSHGSSQYNRIKIPIADVTNNGPGKRESYGFYRLQSNTAYGTFHFSNSTLHEMQVYLEQHFEGSDVHGIFGEGVNPKMRKIREALNRLGFPDDQLLQAGSPRALYVVPLAHNFRRILKGQDIEPVYFFPHDTQMSYPDATQRLVELWRKRWLFKRAAQVPVQSEVKRHSLKQHSFHGALVIRTIPNEDQVEASAFCAQPVLPIFETYNGASRDEESYEYPLIDAL